MDMFKFMNHCIQNIITSTPDASSTSDTKSVLFHQGYYLTETKTKRYKITHQTSQGSIPVVTIVHPTTKVDHTFNVEYKYLNKYLVCFRVSYCCGSKDHYIPKD